MAIFGVALVMQAIYFSSGSLADVNQMIWEYGVFYGGLAVFALYTFVIGAGYNKVATLCA